jgi:hypothetical protein
MAGAGAESALLTLMKESYPEKLYSADVVLLPQAISFASGQVLTDKDVGACW